MSTNLGSTPKNQHYVPQFYLRRFSINGKSVASILFEPYTILPTVSIAGQSSKRYFYGKDGRLEKDLKGLEDATVPVFNKLHLNPTALSLTPAEREVLLAYILYQYYRTPVERENSLVLAKLGALDTASEVIQLAKDPVFAFIMAEAHRQIIDDLEISMLVNKSELEFITSDFPIVLCNPLYCENKHYDKIIFSNQGILVYYPIDPETCILLYDKSVYKIQETVIGTVTVTSTRDIMSINSLQHISAQFNLYYRDASRVYFRMHEYINLLKSSMKLYEKKIEQVPMPMIKSAMLQFSLYDKHRLIPSFVSIINNNISIVNNDTMPRSLPRVVSSAKQYIAMIEAYKSNKK